MSLKILVVEDDEVFAHLHKSVVKRSGFPEVPLCFADGIPALEFLKNQPQNGTAYLLLLDINMPRMDGWQLLDALQALPLADSVKVVMATSSTLQEDREKAFAYPQVIDYKEKPLRVQDFKEIMERPDVAQLES